MSQNNSQPASPIDLMTAADPLSAPNIGSHIFNAYGSTFNVPAGIKLVQFNGTDWSNWAGTFEAIMTIYEADNHLCIQNPPLEADSIEWYNVQQCLKAYLHLYMTSGVYSQISSDIEYPSLKDK
jgi:hypothetical protein